MHSFIGLRSQLCIMNCELNLEFPREEHRHLHCFRRLCGCMFSLGVEHDVVFACPASVVVADIYHSESPNPFCAAPEVAYEVSSISYLSCLILHGWLSVYNCAYRYAVAVAH